MVNHCSVAGCTSRVGKKPNVSFYRFPSEKENDRRLKWIAAVSKRKGRDWTPGKQARVCSEHFISGKPRDYQDDVDYVPSIFPWSHKRKVVQSSQRNARLQKRRVVQAVEEVIRDINIHINAQAQTPAQQLPAESTNTGSNVSVCSCAPMLGGGSDDSACSSIPMVGVQEQAEPSELPNLEAQGQTETSELVSMRAQEGVDSAPDHQPPEPASMGILLQEQTVARVEQENEMKPQLRQQGTQTEDVKEQFTRTVEELQKENAELKQHLKKEKFSVETIEANDTLTKFYTGLPAWIAFVHLFYFLSPYVGKGNALTPMNELFLVLLRLRLNLTSVDIAHRFHIGLSTVSRIFQKWIDVMYIRLRFLVKWPSRDVVECNMPEVFRQLYPKCRCIIDCSEIYIETPTSFDARAQTYSNYKKHNTVKFFIAITPCGSISFLSKCWGGRVSDKNLTQECGFLNLLDPGDVVLADRGFTIDEDISLHGARLEVPSFTRGKKQLTQEEVELSKQLSRVRIHVERVIGLLKNKFTILKGPIQISLLKHKDDVDVANIDKILHICSALTNICESVVPM